MRELNVELQPAGPEHAEALDRAVAESLEHLRPWMPWVADEPMPIEDRRAMLDGWQRGTDEVFVILVDGDLGGVCGLHRRIGPHAFEMGYWVHAAYVRRGVATEAARLATDEAFAHPGIERVEIHHDKANALSGRVPARLGYRLIGEQPDPPRTPAESGIERIWRMERERWLSSGRARATPS